MKKPKHFWSLLGILLSGAFAVVGISFLQNCFWQLDLMRDVMCSPYVNEPMDLWKIEFGFPWIDGTHFMPLQRAWDLAIFYGFFGTLISWALSSLILLISLWFWED